MRNSFLRDLAFLMPSGIQQLTTSSFTIYSKKTLTGIEMTLLTDPSFSERSAQDILALVYSSYTDLVLKDPFYAMDMPIRCSLFDRAIRQILAIA